MRAAKTSTPPGLQIRLGRRWPRTMVPVIDDGLLGRDWNWEDEDDDGTTQVRAIEPPLYLA